MWLTMSYILVLRHPTPPAEVSQSCHGPLWNFWELNLSYTQMECSQSVYTHLGTDRTIT